MTNKLWSALNDIDEHLIDLDGIRQHLNFALDSDASKPELETAISFATRLLERFENDLDDKLKNVWSAYRKEKGILDSYLKTPTVHYNDIINSEDL